jgi:hypothetical protein
LKIAVMKTILPMQFHEELFNEIYRHTHG